MFIICDTVSLLNCTDCHRRQNDGGTLGGAHTHKPGKNRQERVVEVEKKVNTFFKS